jgi:uncharacterized protein YprB with RNaseH-like and TPR domain
MKNILCIDIETTGLNPLFGDSITCICAKTKNEEYRNDVSEQDEKELLLDFMNWFADLEYFDLIVTKNGKNFDIPFIFIKCMIYDISFEKDLMFFPHFDLQELTTKRISLQSMAEMYCLDGKNGTGINAIKLYKEKRFSELLNYCWQDVLLIEKIYKIYRQIQRK